MKDQVNREQTDLINFTQDYRQKLQKPRPLKYYLKLVEKGLLIHAKYKSTITNGNYLVYGSFEKLGEHLKKIKHDLIATPKELRVLFQEPVCVLTLSIFGKGKSATKCINCGESKNILINMNEELLVRYKKLWSYVNKAINKEVILDS